MKKIFKNQIALALAGILAGTSAVAGTLVINGDTSDPAPKAAFQAVIDGFEAENPDVDVVYNLFDHEGYKAAIRNFLSADAPDIAFWYAEIEWLHLLKLVFLLQLMMYGLTKVYIH